MILIIGATGTVGKEVVTQLMEKGEQIRVLTRDSRKVAHLDPRIERFTGDLDHPETLEPAFEGVGRLFLITFQAPQAIHAVEAAKRAGIQQIVKLSSLEASKSHLKIGRWHREREEIIEASGIGWVFLRPGMFTAIVLVVIIAMAVILGAGELSNKADPTSTTYTPRPEWYFFFLFEVLRVIKPPELVPLATIGVPTIAMILLVLLPFYDRNPERRPERRPIATTAAVATIAAMAYLTWLGAHAEAPDKIDLKVPESLEAGQTVANQSGCGACHKFGEAGNATLGPDLTEIGSKLPPQAIERTLRNPTAPMPSYADLPPEKFDALVEYLAALK